MRRWSRTRRVELSRAQCRSEIGAPVQALATGRDLDAAEQQVEALRGAAVAARRRVERPGGQREAHDEYRRDAGLLLGERAQPALGFGVEVVDEVVRAVRLREALEALVELPDRCVRSSTAAARRATVEQVAACSRLSLPEHRREQLPLELR